MRLTFLFVGLLWTGIACTGAAAQDGAGAEDSTAAPQTYGEMRSQVVALYGEKRYDEAAALLQGALARFPDHLMANSYNLALMYGHLHRLEEGIAVLKSALDQGAWFNRNAFAPADWDPYRELPGFQKVAARSDSLLGEAQKLARPGRLVLLPEPQENGRLYPLFLALHGGGENIAVFKEHWVSPAMRRRCIVAYLQSSLLIGLDAYNWTEDLDVSRREIRAAYERILSEYPVDPARTIIGGFSSGGVAALETAFDGTIPAAGFIALCPARPDGLTPERIAAAKERGLKGTLWTTEMDRRIEDQRRLEEMFTEAGLDHHFEVTPNIGHWYPDDMPARLDAAIEHILGREP